MRFEINLKEEDYLTLSLFLSSKSKMTKKRRRRPLIILSGTFMFLSLSALVDNHPAITWWMYLIIGLVLIFLFDFYQRWLYTTTYRKSIAERYKNRLGKPAWLEFTDEHLLSGYHAGEAKINLEQLEHIYELGRHYILKFKTGEGLIVNKAEISQTDFKAVIIRLIEQYQVPFTEDLNWKFS